MKIEDILGNTSLVANSLFGSGGSVDVHEALTGCRDVLRSQVLQEFHTESDPFGEPWEPWYWTSDYPPEEHPTLRHTGLLYGSFVSDGAGHVEEITNNELVFGSSVTYAMKHQEGASEVLAINLFGRHGGMLKAGSQIEIPARPIVGWPDETIVQCGDLIRDEITEQWYAL